MEFLVTEVFKLVKKEMKELEYHHVYMIHEAQVNYDYYYLKNIDNQISYAP